MAGVTRAVCPAVPVKRRPCGPCAGCPALLASACVRRAIFQPTFLPLLASLFGAHLAAAPLVPGEFVRVTRGEMLTFEGKNLAGSAKGQDFPLLKHDAAGRRVFVAYMKDDGTLVAATLPDDSVEPGPPNGPRDLVLGVEAFRDQRYDDAKRLLARAATDKETSALASALAARVNGALVGAAQGRSGTAAGRQAFGTTLQSLRVTAAQLEKAGHTTLALAIDIGADRLGGALSVSTLDRAALTQRAEIARRSVMRARQAAGLKRFIEVAAAIDDGLKAEPAQAELKAMQPHAKRQIDDAEDLYKTANKMRRFDGGAIHALSAIDDGLKLCADHAKLRELRRDLAAQFEERTSPQVTPAFLAAAKVSTPRGDLETGRALYTERCTSCHDLDMLDSRTRTAWESIVSGMARRAGLSAGEKAMIMDYITAAQAVVEAGGR